MLFGLFECLRQLMGIYVDLHNCLLLYLFLFAASYCLYFHYGECLCSRRELIVHRLLSIIFLDCALSNSKGINLLYIDEKIKVCHSHSLGKCTCASLMGVPILYGGGLVYYFFIYWCFFWCSSNDSAVALPLYCTIHV